LHSSRALAAAAFLVLSGLTTAARSDTSATASLNGEVTLEWSAPGDDSLTGRATRYALRYKIVPFSEASFLASIAIPGVPAPKPAGQVERHTVSGLTPGTTYYFALKTVDDAGNWSRMSNVVGRTASNTVGVAGGGVAEFAPPFPNPARSSATFVINVPQESEVVIEAFDIGGRRVATIARGLHNAGLESLVWNLTSDEGRRVSAGIYLVRARIGATRFVRRVIVAG